MARPADRSYGYLPLRPLRHDGSTAVGLVDLDSSSEIMWISGDDGDARDQLLLVRLHGQPVAAVDLEAAPGTATRADLLSAMSWESGSELLSHIQRCDCLPLPSGPDGLDAILEDDDGACPERSASRPAGRAAVIVCTAGRTDLLSRALESLARMRCEDWELVVVDNRPSNRATRELVESMSAEVPIRYVAEPRPGLARARNAGLAAVPDAAVVAFTDDDVLVDEAWLAWLLAPFNESRVHAVTGLVMPLKLESAAQKRFEIYAGFGKGFSPDSYVLKENRDEDRFLFLYPYWGGMFGSGNSMAFRRDALLEAGGFDPALGAGTATGGGEDIAAFTDIVLGGGKLVYEPRSICWHEHRGDETALVGQIRNYGIGLTAVFWRYTWKDRRFILAAIRSLSLLPRLLKRRRGERDENSLPDDLWKLEARGRLLGPWCYTLSWINAERASRRR
jgi:glycosyltransferase involved in cell wall biosynthesis